MHCVRLWPHPSVQHTRPSDDMDPLTAPALHTVDARDGCCSACSCWTLPAATTDGAKTEDDDSAGISPGRLSGCGLGGAASPGMLHGAVCSNEHTVLAAWITEGQQFCFVVKSPRRVPWQTCIARPAAAATRALGGWV